MKKKTAKVWTKEKIALLKKLYPTNSNEKVASDLKVTVRSVRNAAVRFRIKKKGRFWDKPEEELLLKFWPTHSPDEIAGLLKSRFGVEKTKWSIINKYRELTGKR